MQKENKIMDNHTLAPARQRLPRWILAGWLAIAIAGVYRFTPVAKASHSHTGSYQIHLANMHNNTVSSTGPGAYDEQYCIVSYSSLSPTTAANFIQETLTALDSSIIWDGTGNYRIDLWRTQKFCDQYTQSERDTIEIEYRIKDYWTAECGGDIYSCVRQAGPLVDPVSGHTHFRWINSLLKTSHISGLNTRARAFINHETGHIWGLRDPSYYGDCTHSVMHNFLYSSLGCTDAVWYPTSSDFTSVRSVMDRTN
jgi:hypothetical protein